MNGIKHKGISLTEHYNTTLPVRQFLYEAVLRAEQKTRAIKKAATWAKKPFSFYGSLLWLLGKIIMSSEMMLTFTYPPASASYSTTARGKRKQGKEIMMITTGLYSELVKFTSCGGNAAKLILLH